MTPDRAHARASALVATAKRLVTDAEGRFSPHPALCRALTEASGLSHEGVRWALEHALEWWATDDDVRTLVANAGPAVTEGPLVLVLAANVTTAALRALACAVARAEEVLVYPSSRDAVLARRLVEDAGVTGLRNLASRDDLPLANPRARVVLYGSADTVRTLRPLVRGTLEIHGPGLGLALLTDETARTSVAALARDVVAFDQRGCLSPRLAVHVGSPERGRALAAELFDELDRLGAICPLGTLEESDRHARALALQTGRALGDVWESPCAAVAHETVAAPSPAPTARMLTVHTTTSRASAEAWLAPLLPLLSALGCDDAAAREGFLRGVPLRRSELGAMQRPRFDGPVDRRPHGPDADVSR